MSREPTATPTASGPLRQRTEGDPAAATSSVETTTATAVAPEATSHAPARADATTPADVEAAWIAYVAAARQLDGVRRGAATAAAEQARAVQAAREELTAVRERLAPQRSRLCELGVPPMALSPTPPELTEATRTMVGGPTAVLAALRAARGWADGADAALAPRRPLRPAGWPPRARNLLVYGPLALFVPLLQLVLYAAVGTGTASVAAVLCGLPMPVVAFVAGWVGVGRLFGGNAAGAAAALGGKPPTGESRQEAAAASTTGSVDPAAPTAGSTGGRLDRTPRWGALVCLVPAVLTTAGLVLAMLAG